MNLKSIIKNKDAIFEGIKNSLITKEDVEEIATERKVICDKCPIKGIGPLNTEICDNTKSGVHIKTNQVTLGCGCFLHLKQRSMGSFCPLGKWDKLTDDDDISNKLSELANE